MEPFIPLSPEVLAQYESEPPKYEPIQRESVSGARYVKTGDGSFRYEKGANRSEVVISCAGDILCEEKLFKAHYAAGCFSFDDVLQFVRPVFRKSDLVIGNLTTTICESSPYTGEQYKIDGKYHCNAPVEFLDAIKQAGFDFLIMSNNHNCDSGVNGLLETLHHVDQRGFMHTGAFTPQDTKRWTIVDVNGIKIAILAYSTWFNHNEDRFTPLGREKLLNVYRQSRAKEDIIGAKADGAEFVLVYMHWGTDTEYKHKQSAAMEKMAQELADCGADYIIGTHTHSIQPHKIIRSADGRSVTCFFSLGNFVTSEQAAISRKNAVLQLKLHKENGIVYVCQETLIPCFVPDQAFGCAYPVLPETFISESESIFKTLEKNYHEIRDAAGQNLGGSFLTTERICSILGVESTIGNRKYTTLNFAMDARKDGVAIIGDKTEDLSYCPSNQRCEQLADLAIEKGAALLISNRQIKDYPCIVVESIFDAFCRIIKAVRSQYSPKAISITGSIGKTTSTQMVYSVLSSKFNTHRNTSSANNSRLAGSVIQQLKPEHEFYVQETMEGPPFGAASNIAQMVRPQAAIVTVVGTSHMEEFGSQERILESCLGVQDGMPEDGLLILNGDDPFQWNAKCDRRTVYYAIDNEQADYRAINIHSEGSCLTFDILHDQNRVQAKIHCFGKHNILNALAAFAAGKWAGMRDQEIVSGLEMYRTSGIRQNLVQYGGYWLFLDCYNAARESMKSAFDALETIQVPEYGRRVAVLADIKEAGKKEKEFHQSVGKMVLDSCIDVLFCYGENARTIADTVRTEGSIPVFHTEDVQELVELLKKEVTKKDITMFKGSHDMALEHIVDLTWGTWFHEEFERYEFKTKLVSDANFQYRVYTDHATVIKKTSTAPDVIIPDYVGGLPVSSLAPSLFEQSKYTKSVTLPSMLINIRYCAFYKASGIQTIHIPSSVRIIDTSAFSTCENLRQVTIEEGCTHLGYRAFGNCKNLESITIPSTVQQIGEEAFLNCDKLTIYGAEDSPAQKYAEEYGIPFALKVDSDENFRPGPNISHNASCALLDALTGEVLYEQKGNKRLLIASLSKIIVAYKLIKTVELQQKNWDWNTQVTLGDEVTYEKLGGMTVNSNSTVLGFKNGTVRYMTPGDMMSLDGLLYGMMIPSGNDAASAIAVALEGSEQAFLELINAQMREPPFSLSDTAPFGRAYGRECYSTAIDIGKMLCVVLRDPDVAPKFWEAAGAKSTEGHVYIHHPNGESEPVVRQNTNHFIGGDYEIHLTREIGAGWKACGKSGTWVSDFNLATAVEHNGRTLIAVVLQASSERERNDSTLALLSWGFQGDK